jgi:hypothetical protein
MIERTRMVSVIHASVPIKAAPGKVAIHAIPIFYPDPTHGMPYPGGPTPETAPPVACVVGMGTLAMVANPIVMLRADGGHSEVTRENHETRLGKGSRAHKRHRAEALTRPKRFEQSHPEMSMIHKKMEVYVRHFWSGQAKIVASTQVIMRSLRNPQRANCQQASVRAAGLRPGEMDVVANNGQQFR